MNLQPRLFASVLILLLSPMAANATLITYTGNPFASGNYLTAEVEINGTAQGVYSRVNLQSLTLNLFDSSDTLMFSLASSTNTGFYNNYVRLDATGAITDWFLYLFSQSPSKELTTYYNDDGSISNCGCGQQEYAGYPLAGVNDDNRDLVSGPSAWASTAVPEPGTLALLAVGFGCMYRRRASAGRV